MTVLPTAKWRQVIRYYQAGIVNTAVGYGLFALFVAAGLNIYLAQVVSHVLGSAFNYVSYSRYAFAGQQGHAGKFFLSYAVNYLIGLAGIWLFSQIFESAYVIGAAAVVLTSIVNYFILSRLVFSAAETA